MDEKREKKVSAQSGGERQKPNLCNICADDKIKSLPTIHKRMLYLLHSHSQSRLISSTELN
jgi:hypothetical protein